MRFTIVPRTITTQITCLIVLSVAIAYGLSIVAIYIFLNSIEGGPRGGGSSGGPPWMQFGTVARLAGAASSNDEINSLLKNARRIGIPVTLVQGPVVALTPEDNTPAAKNSFEQFKREPGMRAMRGSLYQGANATALFRLPDGNSLSFPLPRHRNFFFPGFVVGPLFYTLAIIGLCLAGLSVYAARFITKPLLAFAAAAHSVGRTTDEEQVISERGPQEIARVARALNEMRRRIRALLDERTSILTAISHDLRTPLTRMKLRAEKLSGTGAEEIGAQGMFSDIARMEQMLSETLIYLRDDSRIESVVSVDLPSILQTICTELSDLGKSIAYRGPDRFTFSCRPSALTRAITNLVDNAIKYGTQTTVNLTVFSGEVQIDVTDNGPGISYNYRDRVFEPFFKIDGARTSNDNEGFGLGLAIARKVVGGHGGEIELLQSVSGGLTVRVNIPVTAPPV